MSTKTAEYSKRQRGILRKRRRGDPLYPPELNGSRGPHIMTQPCFPDSGFANNPYDSRLFPPCSLTDPVEDFLQLRSPSDQIDRPRLNGWY